MALPAVEIARYALVSRRPRSTVVGLTLVALGLGLVCIVASNEVAYLSPIKLR